MNFRKIQGIQKEDQDKSFKQKKKFLVVSESLLVHNICFIFWKYVVYYYFVFYNLLMNTQYITAPMKKIIMYIKVYLTPFEQK